MKRKFGFEYCAVCEKEFHISDPAIFAFDKNKQLCRNCFEEALAKTSWSAIHERHIIIDYVKVSIPHSLKWDVWKRDMFKCVICEAEDNLSVDHIHPESLGGDLHLSNLRTLCRTCNSRKSNRV